MTYVDMNLSVVMNLSSADGAHNGFQGYPRVLLSHFVKFLVCYISEEGLLVPQLTRTYSVLYLYWGLFTTMPIFYVVDFNWPYYMTCHTEWITQGYFWISIGRLPSTSYWDYNCQSMRNPILWEWMNSCPNKSKMTSAQLLCFADVVHNRFHCYPLGLLLCYDKSLITFISHDVFIGHLLTLINATLYVCRLILALPTYLLSRGTQFELQHEYFCFQFLLH